MPWNRAHAKAQRRQGKRRQEARRCAGRAASRGRTFGVCPGLVNGPILRPCGRRRVAEYSRGSSAWRYTATGCSRGIGASIERDGAAAQFVRLVICCCERSAEFPRFGSLLTAHGCPRLGFLLGRHAVCSHELIVPSLAMARAVSCRGFRMICHHEVSGNLVTRSSYGGAAYLPHAFRILTELPHQPALGLPPPSVSSSCHWSEPLACRTLEAVN